MEGVGPERWAARSGLRGAPDAAALCEAAEACGLGPLLEGPASLFLEAVAYDDHPAAPILHHLADTGMAEQLRDLLVGPEFVRRFRRRGRVAGVQWLLDTLRAFFEAELAALPGDQPNVQAAVPGAPGPESSAEAVQAWAEQQRVADLLQLPVGVLLARLSGRSHQHLARFPSRGRILHLFDAPTAGVGVLEAAWPPVPFSVKLAACDWLQEEAGRVASWRGISGVPEGAEALSGAVEAFAGVLREAADGLRVHTAPRPWPPLDGAASAECFVDPASDVLRLGPPAGALACVPGGVPEVSLDLGADRPADLASCACGGDASRCRHTLSALECLREALARRVPAVVEGIAARRSAPRWSRELELLAAATREPVDGVPTDAQPAWLVRVDGQGELSVAAGWVRPFRRKAGFRTWTGRTASAHPSDDAVFDQLRLLDSIRGAPEPARRALVFRAVECLVGHEAVFLSYASSGEVRPLAVREADVGLALGPGDAPDTLALSVSLNGLPWPHEQARREVLGRCAGGRSVWLDTELFVAHISEAASRLLQLVLDRGPHYPRSALGTLADRLPVFEEAVSVTIAESLIGPAVAPAPRLQLQLAWKTPPNGPEQLRLRVRVCALPGARPRRPGLGPGRALGQGVGGPCHCHRDRPEERALAVELLEFLGLAPPEEADARWEWRLDAPLPALDTVMAVDGLVADRRDVAVVWDGPRPGVQALERPDALSLSVRPSGRGGWFRLDGALAVDAAELALADLLDQARRGWRQVRVAPGQWVTLSDALHRRLEALAAVVRGSQNPELPGFSGGVVDELSGLGVVLDADARWCRIRQRAADAAAAEVTVPRALRCTLRPYQERGFAWMVRLTSWGAGGILADDMGLGKTIQALALLLHRAELGPALVVAPSSLVFNWRAEAHRFAPSLTIRTYRGAEREHLLHGLQPGHVLLTTYDIVARDAERLAAQPFSTLILDEAQAIKNASTQRAQAIHGLQAEARVALSGTPIENRLEELWSLLEAVCPGLLGSRASFVDDFVQPIEVDGDTDRQAALARVIQPFVLRRLKREVAAELPERITVVRQVVPRPDQAGHYARERERAVLETRQLLASEADGARFRVLAWITRLRMLACHPAMVDPGWTGGSAKLDHALELVGELVEGGHSVLVFSQFTRHLDLVAEGLGALGVGFCRIDGRTTPGRRADAVERFQERAVPVFLLSLKAGGVGLNLTAADHVLLLDPWWNPAAEDQAADRAHRIGQTEPVTITRLVTAGTLEADILALQAEKRALVEATLTGTATAGGLDGAQLAALIEGSDALRSRPDTDIPF